MKHIEIIATAILFVSMLALTWYMSDNNRKMIDCINEGTSAEQCTNEIREGKR